MLSARGGLNEELRSQGQLHLRPRAFLGHATTQNSSSRRSFKTRPLAGIAADVSVTFFHLRVYLHYVTSHLHHHPTE